LRPESRLVDDERLVVARASRRDEAAWAELFDRHYVKLYRFFRARVGTDETAEDLASETLLQAFRSIERFVWRQIPFGAWLFAIARRVLASHYRRPRLRADPLDHAEPGGHVRDEYLAVEVRDVLGRLSPEHRTALELKYVVGLSGEEAAAAMGRSHAAFRSLLHRAARSYRNASAWPEVEDFKAAGRIARRRM
jgi:RNA polymerase sigma-70 factor, ECF subfamily